MELVGISAWIIAMGVSWAATPLVIRLADWIGAVDAPGGRKTHRAPVPRIGGISVFLGFFAGMAFAAYAAGVLWNVPENAVYWRGLAFAALGMLLVGLIDDLRGLRYYWKFMAQIAAAVYVWSCGFAVEVISSPLGGGVELSTALSFAVTVIWIVGITNAVNLIDGLDGLAAGIALITTSTVAAIAFARGELGVTAASVTLAGALIGFLRFNFNPARIFLGDSGSLFLGFVLAVTSVRGSQKGPTAVALLVPLLVLGVPLLDTGLAVVRRLTRLQRRSGKRIGAVYMLRNVREVFLPDRGHIHHRLVETGLGHRGAVLTLYFLACAFAGAALVLVLSRSIWVGVLLIVVLFATMAAFLMVLYLRIEPAGVAGSGESRSDDGGAPRPGARGAAEPTVPEPIAASGAARRT